MRLKGWDGPEVLAFEVLNVGRATLTATGYSIYAVGTGMSYSPIGDQIGRELPFRLEPGEAETWQADLQDARALVHSLAAAIGKSATRVNMSVGLETKQEFNPAHG